MEIDIPSANLHVIGLDFVERISGVRMIPRSTETGDENTDPRTNQDKKKKKINVLVNECFRAVLRKPVEGMRDRWSG
jgi:hypothetical protein